MFTESVKYAIQTMMHLAVNQNDFFLINTIAEDYDIPKFYLSKLVQSLSNYHLVRSKPGRNGGIKLNKPSEEIKIIDIIYAIEGPPPEKEMCIFGIDICSDSVPCPVHEKWKPMKKKLHNEFMEKDLASLAKELHRKHEILGNIIDKK